MLFKARTQYKMKLRDHPLMTRKSGASAWPPLWVDTRGSAYGKPRGEIGFLKKVEKHDAIANGLFLWIAYEGATYVGVTHFDDPPFCRAIHEILAYSIGLAIRDIGGLDLSYTL
jgi:hypothetical protein